MEFGVSSKPYANTTRHKQANDPRLAGLNTLTFSVWISRGAGLVLTVDGMLILLPVCRTLVRFVRPKIKFLPLDENLWFHRQLAYSMLLFAIIHTAGHYVKYVFYLIYVTAEEKIKLTSQLL